MTPSTETRNDQKSDFQNESTPSLEAQHRSLTLKLRKVCRPDSHAEEKTFQRYACASFERRADKSMNELRQLQRDRFAAYEVYAKHCVMGKDVNILKSLPVADIRKSDLAQILT